MIFVVATIFVSIIYRAAGFTQSQSINAPNCQSPLVMSGFTVPYQTTPAFMGFAGNYHNICHLNQGASFPLNNYGAVGAGQVSSSWTELTLLGQINIIGTSAANAEMWWLPLSGNNGNNQATNMYSLASYENNSSQLELAFFTPVATATAKLITTISYTRAYDCTSRVNYTITQTASKSTLSCRAGGTANLYLFGISPLFNIFSPILNDPQLYSVNGNGFITLNFTFSGNTVVINNPRLVNFYMVGAQTHYMQFMMLDINSTYPWPAQCGSYASESAVGEMNLLLPSMTGATCSASQSESRSTSHKSRSHHSHSESHSKTHHSHSESHSITRSESVYEPKCESPLVRSAFTTASQTTPPLVGFAGPYPSLCRFNDLINTEYYSAIGAGQVGSGATTLSLATTIALVGTNSSNANLWFFPIKGFNGDNSVPNKIPWTQFASNGGLDHYTNLEFIYIAPGASGSASLVLTLSYTRAGQCIANVAYTTTLTVGIVGVTCNPLGTHPEAWEFVWTNIQNNFNSIVTDPLMYSTHGNGFMSLSLAFSGSGQTVYNPRLYEIYIIGSPITPLRKMFLDINASYPWPAQCGNFNSGTAVGEAILALNPSEPTCSESDSHSKSHHSDSKSHHSDSKSRHSDSHSKSRESHSHSHSKSHDSHSLSKSHHSDSHSKSHKSDSHSKSHHSDSHSKSHKSDSHSKSHKSDSHSKSHHSDSLSKSHKSDSHSKSHKSDSHSKSHHSDSHSKSHESDSHSKSHHSDSLSKSHESDSHSKSHESNSLSKSHESDSLSDSHHSDSNSQSLDPTRSASLSASHGSPSSTRSVYHPSARRLLGDYTCSATIQNFGHHSLIVNNINGSNGVCMPPLSIYDGVLEQNVTAAAPLVFGGAFVAYNSSAALMWGTLIDNMIPLNIQIVAAVNYGADSAPYCDPQVILQVLSPITPDYCQYSLDITPSTIVCAPISTQFLSDFASFSDIDEFCGVNLTGNVIDDIYACDLSALETAGYLLQLIVSPPTNNASCAGTVYSQMFSTFYGFNITDGQVAISLVNRTEGCVPTDVPACVPPEFTPSPTPSASPEPNYGDYTCGATIENFGANDIIINNRNGSHGVCVPPLPTEDGVFQQNITDARPLVFGGAFVAYNSSAALMWGTLIDPANNILIAMLASVNYGAASSPYCDPEVIMQVLPANTRDNCQYSLDITPSTIVCQRIAGAFFPDGVSFLHLEDFCGVNISGAIIEDVYSCNVSVIPVGAYVLQAVFTAPPTNASCADAVYTRMFTIFNWMNTTGGQMPIPLVNRTEGCVPTDVPACVPQSYSQSISSSQSASMSMTPSCTHTTRNTGYQPLVFLNPGNVDNFTGVPLSCEDVLVYNQFYSPAEPDDISVTGLLSVLPGDLYRLFDASLPLPAFNYVIVQVLLSSNISAEAAADGVLVSLSYAPYDIPYASCDLPYAYTTIYCEVLASSSETFCDRVTNIGFDMSSWTDYNCSFPSLTVGDYWVEISIEHTSLNDTQSQVFLTSIRHEGDSGGTIYRSFLMQPVCQQYLLPPECVAPGPVGNLTCTPDIQNYGPNAFVINDMNATGDLCRRGLYDYNVPDFDGILATDVSASTPLVFAGQYKVTTNDESRIFGSSTIFNASYGIVIDVLASLENFNATLSVAPVVVLTYLPHDIPNTCDDSYTDAPPSVVCTPTGDDEIANGAQGLFYGQPVVCGVNVSGPIDSARYRCPLNLTFGVYTLKILYVPPANQPGMVYPQLFTLISGTNLTGGTAPLTFLPQTEGCRPLTVPGCTSCSPRIRNSGSEPLVFMPANSPSNITNVPAQCRQVPLIFNEHYPVGYSDDINITTEWDVALGGAFRMFEMTDYSAPFEILEIAVATGFNLTVGRPDILGVRVFMSYALANASGADNTLPCDSNAYTTIECVGRDFSINICGGAMSYDYFGLGTLGSGYDCMLPDVPPGAYLLQISVIHTNFTASQIFVTGILSGNITNGTFYYLPFIQPTCSEFVLSHECVPLPPTQSYSQSVSPSPLIPIGHRVCTPQVENFGSDPLLIDNYNGSHGVCARIGDHITPDYVADGTFGTNVSVWTPFIFGGPYQMINPGFLVLWNTPIDPTQYLFVDVLSTVNFDIVDNYYLILQDVPEILLQIVPDFVPGTCPRNTTISAETILCVPISGEYSRHGDPGRHNIFCGVNYSNPYADIKYVCNTTLFALTPQPGTLQLIVTPAGPNATKLLYEQMYVRLRAYSAIFDSLIVIPLLFPTENCTAVTLPPCTPESASDSHSASASQSMSHYSPSHQSQSPSQPCEPTLRNSGDEPLVFLNYNVPDNIVGGGTTCPIYQLAFNEYPDVGDIEYINITGKWIVTGNVTNPYYQMFEMPAPEPASPTWPGVFTGLTVTVIYAATYPYNISDYGVSASLAVQTNPSDYGLPCQSDTYAPDDCPLSSVEEFPPEYLFEFSCPRITNYYIRVFFMTFACRFYVLPPAVDTHEPVQLSIVHNRTLVPNSQVFLGLITDDTNTFNVPFMPTPCREYVLGADCGVTQSQSMSHQSVSPKLNQGNYTCSATVKNFGPDSIFINNFNGSNGICGNGFKAYPYPPPTGPRPVEAYFADGTLDDNVTIWTPMIFGGPFNYIEAGDAVLWGTEFYLGRDIEVHIIATVNFYNFTSLPDYKADLHAGQEDAPVILIQLYENSMEGVCLNNITNQSTTITCHAYSWFVIPRSDYYDQDYVTTPNEFCGVPLTHDTPLIDIWYTCDLTTLNTSYADLVMQIFPGGANASKIVYEQMYVRVNAYSIYDYYSYIEIPLVNRTEGCRPTELPGCVPLVEGCTPTIENFGVDPLLIDNYNGKGTICPQGGKPTPDYADGILDTNVTIWSPFVFGGALSIIETTVGEIWGTFFDPSNGLFVEITANVNFPVLGVDQDNDYAALVADQPTVILQTVPEFEQGECPRNTTFTPGTTHCTFDEVEYVVNGYILISGNPVVCGVNHSQTFVKYFFICRTSAFSVGTNAELDLMIFPGGVNASKIVFSNFYAQVFVTQNATEDVIPLTFLEESTPCAPVTLPPCVPEMSPSASISPSPSILRSHACGATIENFGADRLLISSVDGVDGVCMAITGVDYYYYDGAFETNVTEWTPLTFGGPLSILEGGAADFWGTFINPTLAITIDLTANVNFPSFGFTPDYEDYNQLLQDVPVVLIQLVYDFSAGQCPRNTSVTTDTIVCSSQSRFYSARSGRGPPPPYCGVNASQPAIDVRYKCRLPILPVGTNAEAELIIFPSGVNASKIVYTHLYMHVEAFQNVSDHRIPVPLLNETKDCKAVVLPPCVPEIIQSPSMSPSASHLPGHACAPTIENFGADPLLINSWDGRGGVCSATMYENDYYDGAFDTNVTAWTPLTFGGPLSIIETGVGELWGTFFDPMRVITIHLLANVNFPSFGFQPDYYDYNELTQDVPVVLLQLLYNVSTGQCPRNMSIDVNTIICNPVERVYFKRRNRPPPIPEVCGVNTSQPFIDVEYHCDLSALPVGTNAEAELVLFPSGVNASKIVYSHLFMHVEVDQNRTDNRIPVPLLNETEYCKAVVLPPCVPAFTPSASPSPTLPFRCNGEHMSVLTNSYFRNGDVYELTEAQLPLFASPYLPHCINSTHLLFNYPPPVPYGIVDEIDVTTTLSVDVSGRYKLFNMGTFEHAIESLEVEILSLGNFSVDQVISNLVVTMYYSVEGEIPLRCDDPDADTDYTMVNCSLVAARDPCPPLSYYAGQDALNIFSCRFPALPHGTYLIELVVYHDNIDLSQGQVFIEKLLGVYNSGSSYYVIPAYQIPPSCVGVIFTPRCPSPMETYSESQSLSHASPACGHPVRDSGPSQLIFLNEGVVDEFTFNNTQCNLSPLIYAASYDAGADFIGVLGALDVQPSGQWVLYGMDPAAPQRVDNLYVTVYQGSNDDTSPADNGVQVFFVYAPSNETDGFQAPCHIPGVYTSVNCTAVFNLNLTAGGDCTRAQGGASYLWRTDYDCTAPTLAPSTNYMVELLVAHTNPSSDQGQVFLGDIIGEYFNESVVTFPVPIFEPACSEYSIGSECPPPTPSQSESPERYVCEPTVQNYGALPMIINNVNGSNGLCMPNYPANVADGVFERGANHSAPIVFGGDYILVSSTYANLWGTEIDPSLGLDVYIIASTFCKTGDSNLPVVTLQPYPFGTPDQCQYTVLPNRNGTACVLVSDYCQRRDPDTVDYGNPVYPTDELCGVVNTQNLLVAQYHCDMSSIYRRRGGISESVLQLVIDPPAPGGPGLGYNQTFIRLEAHQYDAGPVIEVPLVNPTTNCRPITLPACGYHSLSDSQSMTASQSPEFGCVAVPSVIRDSSPGPMVLEITQPSIWPWPGFYPMCIDGNELIFNLNSDYSTLTLGEPDNIRITTTLTVLGGENKLFDLHAFQYYFGSYVLEILSNGNFVSTQIISNVTVTMSWASQASCIDQVPCSFPAAYTVVQCYLYDWGWPCESMNETANLYACNAPDLPDGVYLLEFAILHANVDPTQSQIFLDNIIGVYAHYEGSVTLPFLNMNPGCEGVVLTSACAACNSGFVRATEPFVIEFAHVPGSGGPVAEGLPNCSSGTLAYNRDFMLGNQNIGILGPYFVDTSVFPYLFSMFAMPTPVPLGILPDTLVVEIIATGDFTFSPPLETLSVYLSVANASSADDEAPCNAPYGSYIINECSLDNAGYGCRSDYYDTQAYYIYNCPLPITSSGDYLVDLTILSPDNTPYEMGLFLGEVDAFLGPFTGGSYLTLVPFMNNECAIGANFSLTSECAGPEPETPCDDSGHTNLMAFQRGSVLETFNDSASCFVDYMLTPAGNMFQGFVGFSIPVDLFDSTPPISVSFMVISYGGPYIPQNTFFMSYTTTCGTYDIVNACSSTTPTLTFDTFPEDCPVTYAQQGNTLPLGSSAFNINHCTSPIPPGARSLDIVFINVPGNIVFYIGDILIQTDDYSVSYDITDEPCTPTLLPAATCQCVECAHCVGASI
jgi:hypothetical protein